MLSLCRQRVPIGVCRYTSILLKYQQAACSSKPPPTIADDMELKTVVKKLNSLAPTTLAGSWDNVGLLVEPTSPHQVKSMLLTNDLTEVVMKEALEKHVDFILSYHPPIFAPLKRLTQSSWKERIIIQCLENRIAVYSPHTSYDAVLGGVNDWLLKPFAGCSKPLEKVYSPMYPSPGGHRLEIKLPKNDSTDLSTNLLATLENTAGVVVVSSNEMENSSAVKLNCTEEGLSRAVDLIGKHDEVKETIEILQLIKPPIPHHGAGRLVTLDDPIPIKDAVAKIKSHLDLQHVRLAMAVDKTTDSVVKKIAVCAGSGASVLKGVCADLYLTGEMSHHEVLDANHRGSSVILCDHSNTERGYFKEHKSQLETVFDNKVKIDISQSDRDPLQVV